MLNHEEPQKPLSETLRNSLKNLNEQHKDAMDRAKEQAAKTYFEELKETESYKNYTTIFSVVLTDEKDVYLLEVGPFVSRMIAEKILDRVLSNLKLYSTVFRRPSKIMIIESIVKNDEN